MPSSQLLEELMNTNTSSKDNKSSPSHLFGDFAVADLLFKVIELRDPATATHSSLMAHYSHLIAKKFDPGKCGWYYAGGLVHDIGKLSMSDLILKGSSSLSPEERLKIQEHVTDGESLLRYAGMSRIVIDIVKYHHERYNGSGYRLGIKGDNIPLSARIAGIADTYATLIEGRPYKAAVSAEKAIDIMLTESELFDPSVLEWFSAQVLGEGRRDFRESRNIAFVDWKTHQSI